MASESEGDLEDGELPSSEDETEEIKIKDEIDKPDTAEPGVDAIKTQGGSSLKRPFESTEGDNEEEKDNRDTPTSPSTKRSKRDKEGTKSVGSDGEEGEIFSDDEEAAYYPQLVKPKKDSKNTAAPFSQDTFGHYGDRDNHTSYRSREGGRYRHHNRRWQQYESERRERGNSRGNDLVGTPIRHDRYHGDKKWSEYVPSLTLETIESRLSRMLALLPTPKTNQISLDEMNYPAPPQWYLKSVSAFNKNKVYLKKYEEAMGNNDNTQDEPVGYTVNDELETSPIKQVNPVSIDTPPFNHQPTQQTVSEISPSSTGPFITNTTPLIGTAMTSVSMETRVSPTVDTPLSIAHGPEHMMTRETGGEGNLVTSQDIIPPPSLSLEGEKETVEEDHSQSLQSLQSSQRKDLTSITKGKRRGGRKSSSPAVRKRNSRNSTNKTISPLLVSIKLSKLPMDSGRLVDSEDTGFNYDDYLDQLNNEEEEEEEEEEDDDRRNNGGFDFKAAAADFWIDTSQSKGGGTGTKFDATSDPLDEEFPLIQGDKGPGFNSGGRGDGVSLTAIVGEQSIDGSVLELEKKKDDSQILKKNISKMKIPRKRKGKDNNKDGGENSNESPENVHVHVPMEQQQQHSNPAAKIPCKYFLNGHCIHKDNCLYSHAVKREKKREMCKFFLQDACDKGDDCLFYHGGFPCRYFHTRHMCYHGDKCKFSHAPLTEETYDILMSVIEPSMRDFVRYPPPPPPLPPLPPLAPPIATPLPFEGPESGVPNPSDLAQGPYVPSYHNSPPVDGHWSTDDTHERNVHVHVPQSVDDGQHWVQRLDEEEKLKTNVRLSPGFSVSELFPEPHPQVLPHDLATQLRKVLLPTPLSTDKEEEKKEDEEFELEYWENKDRDNLDPTNNTGQEQSSPNSLPPSSLPPPFHSPPSSHVQSIPHPQHIFTDNTRPLLDHPIPPPALMPVGPRPGFMPTPPGLVLIRHNVPPRPFPPHPPIIIRGPPPPNLAPPFYPGPHPPGDHAPPLLGPSPQHRFAPPLHVGSGIISETAPDPRSASDPRFSRLAKSPPRPQALHQSPPTSRPDPTSIDPPSLITSRSSENFSSSFSQSLPETRARGGRSAPPTSASSVWGSSGGSADKNESVRLVNPREKYSHLKIKPKTSGGGMSPDSSTLSSVLKKQHDVHQEEKRKEERHLPSLLLKTTVLDKPLPPHELFGTPPKDGENISLFGSRQQVPDSPIPNETQAFGEIKMSEDPLQGSVKVGGDSEEGHTPSVPSYLTHLGLGLQEDDNDVQIESAFGSLQAKQRRLSEMSASLISEDTLSSQPEPHPSSDATTPTTEASNISKMFSFGSSLY